MMVIKMNHNHASLINQVESTAILEHRFKDMQCVNVKQSRRRGVMSLVFQGLDVLENKDVALKFMDPNKLGDVYRITSFEREPEIIEKLDGKKRCVNLVSSINTFDWDLIIPGNNMPAKIPIKYFAVDWIEEDIDDYFLLQHQIDAIEKLKIFRLILLAIESVHAEEVSHRDIKPDNLRCSVCEGKKIVIVIDFGAAARVDSPSIATAYNKSVGAPAYSPPETFVGFSGNREIGHLTDTYALGCLLYELFNKKLFAIERSANQHFDSALTLMNLEVNKYTSWEDQFNAWQSTMYLIKNIVEPPVFVGSSCDAPKAIQDILSRAYKQMVQFDFRLRPKKLSEIRRLIDSSIIILRNEIKQQEILQHKRELRNKRKEKIRIREEKLNRRLNLGVENVRS